MTTAEIGILGGSGFYELLTNADEHQLDTPYGRTSDAIVTGQFAGRSVAFLPRHGRGHLIPPHAINYRANLWALKQFGITRLIAPCAVGGLKPDLTPGTFVALDQFVDRTKARRDTYFDGPNVTHVSMADPYCPQLRGTVIDALATSGVPHRDSGTIVVIEGPRFSTRAESRWFSAAGWDVVGMTQYPEIPLARELALCVTGLAMVTDHDAGLEDHPDIEAVSAAAVVEVFNRNVATLKSLLTDVVGAIPAERTCDCAAALDQAQM